MPAPPVYLDECIHGDLSLGLRRRGFTVTTTFLEGMSGARDAAQLAFAADRGWTLMTQNGRDFRRLHHAFLQQGRPHSGIIVLPHCPLARLTLRAAMTLDWLELQGGSMVDRLVLWNDVQSALNRGVWLRGYTVSEVREATGQNRP